MKRPGLRRAPRGPGGMVVAAALVGLLATACAGEPAPLPRQGDTIAPAEERKSSLVRGNLVLTSGSPPVTLELDDALQYLGGRAFLLYGVAAAEVHLFVAAEGRRVQRLYWIQLERFLEDNRRTYDYSSSPRRTTLGGYPYFDDVWRWDLDRRRRRPGSDTEQVLGLLAERGYSLGPEVMGIRLVRLGAAARSELMIVYLEDLRDHGLTIAALQRSPRRWKAVSRGLRARALASMRVRAPWSRACLEAGGTSRMGRSRLYPR